MYITCLDVEGVLVPEIWIDCYQIMGFLYRNQSETARNDETKEWRRIYEMKDPAAEKYERTLDFSMYP